MACSKDFMNDCYQWPWNWLYKAVGEGCKKVAVITGQKLVCETIFPLATGITQICLCQEWNQFFTMHGKLIIL